jgi:hypothetical protein
MEFRRITNLPPYVFTIINNLKIEARRAGVDVIDLGFGNPDIPSPQIAVDKLAEAAHIERNHRYSLSRGLPKLREAVAALYERKWGVVLDQELEITNTIGSKEGFSHLMWGCSTAAACDRTSKLPDPHLRPLFASRPVRCRAPTLRSPIHADFFDNSRRYGGVARREVLVISPALRRARSTWPCSGRRLRPGEDRGPRQRHADWASTATDRRRSCRPRVPRRWPSSCTP